MIKWANEEEIPYFHSDGLAGEWKVFVISEENTEELPYKLMSLIPSMKPYQGNFKTTDDAKKRAQNIFLRWSLKSNLIS